MAYLSNFFHSPTGRISRLKRPAYDIISRHLAVSCRGWRRDIPYDYMNTKNNIDKKQHIIWKKLNDVFFIIDIYLNMCYNKVAKQT